MSDGALDFSRYAPDRMRLVSSQPVAPARPGELGQLFSVIRNALVLIRQCLRIAAGIIWRRTRGWVEAHILHDLWAAWVSSGIGWGLFIGAAIVMYFAR